MTLQSHIGSGYRFPRRTQHRDKYITSLVPSSQSTVVSGGNCTLFFSRWSSFDIRKGKQCDLQRPDCSKSRRSLVKLRLTTKSSRISASLFIELSYPEISTTDHGIDKIPLNRSCSFACSPNMASKCRIILFGRALARNNKQGSAHTVHRNE